MAQAKLLLDTNIVIDYLNEREPYYQKARLLMIAGRVGEFDLWMSSSQINLHLSAPILVLRMR